MIVAMGNEDKLYDARFFFMHTTKIFSFSCTLIDMIVAMGNEDKL